MGWFDLFKKNRKRCLVCDSAIRGDKFSLVKYHYLGDDNNPLLGEAHLCESCSQRLDKQAEEQNNVEPI